MRIGTSKQQCSLLFLYLLRYSSAFASSREAIPRSLAGEECNSESSASTTLLKSHQQATLPQQTYGHSGAVASSSEEKLDGHISLRMARREDVPSIQRCNLATLPENYNSNFYCSHMRQWPYLALVAEHVPASHTISSGSDTFSGQGGGIARFFGSGYDASSGTSPCRIVGYVLGKVDEPQPPQRVYIACDQQKPQQRGQELKISNNQLQGHVTSLAILQPFRGRGLAKHLMNQLHYHMGEHHGADVVGLHVRVSNQAAMRLYEGGLGYEVRDLIRGYYQDGEDAFWMQKILERYSVVEEDTEPSNIGSGSTWFGNLKSFTMGVKASNLSSHRSMKLPRILWSYDSAEEESNFSTSLHDSLDGSVQTDENDVLCREERVGVKAFNNY
jgi:ribosomal protein S18 acetylase RimI-like enzyme